MSVLDREALEQSPLADLHAIASELSLDGYRRLRKQQLIDAILVSQGEAEAAGPEADDGEAVEAVEAADEREDEEPAEPAEPAEAPEAESDDEEEERPARRRRGRRGGRGRAAARSDGDAEGESDGNGDSDAHAGDGAAAGKAEAEPEEREAEPADEVIEGEVDLLPNGVSHSIDLTVGSSDPSLNRSCGNAAGRSSKRAPSATSDAGRPLIASIRTSEANRSERRGARRGPEILSPDTSSQRLTWAAEM